MWRRRHAVASLRSVLRVVWPPDRAARGHQPSIPPPVELALDAPAEPPDPPTELDAPGAWWPPVPGARRGRAGRASRRQAARARAARRVGRGAGAGDSAGAATAARRLHLIGTGAERADAGEDDERQGRGEDERRSRTIVGAGAERHARAPGNRRTNASCEPPRENLASRSCQGVHAPRPVARPDRQLSHGARERPRTLRAFGPVRRGDSGQRQENELIELWAALSSRRRGDGSPGATSSGVSDGTEAIWIAVVCIGASGCVSLLPPIDRLAASEASIRDASAAGVGARRAGVDVPVARRRGGGEGADADGDR